MLGLGGIALLFAGTVEQSGKSPPVVPWMQVRGQLARHYQVVPQPSRLPTNYHSQVAGLVFNPNGTLLATSGGGRLDRTVDIWETQTLQLRYTLEPASGSNTHLGFSRNGKVLATWGYGSTISLWDAETGKRKSEVTESHGFVNASISADSRSLATANNRDLSVKIWDIESGRLTATISQKKQLEYADGADVAFNPNGKTIATCSQGEVVYSWDANSLALVAKLIDSSVEISSGPLGLRTLKGFSHGDTIYNLMFSPDGRTLATASRDGTVKLWDAASGQLTATLRHDSGAAWLAFSPDGKTVATGSKDHTARMWDVATGRLIATLAHKGEVWSLAFSPDGKMLATGSDNEKVVHLWNAATGELIADLDGARPPLAFSPQEPILATSSHDAKVLLWRFR